MALDSMIYGTNHIATHSFSEGAETKHIERIAPSAGIVSGWEATKSVSAVGAVASFSLACVGKGRIVIGATATSASSAKDDSVSFRLVFKDASGDILGVSAKAECVLTSFEYNSVRFGTLVVFSNDCGASSIEVFVEAIKAGVTFTLGLAAI